MKNVASPHPTRRHSSLVLLILINVLYQYSNTFGSSVTSMLFLYIVIQEMIKTPWSESASELYRPSDRRLLAK
jgi:hypothetical protein